MSIKLMSAVVSNTLPVPNRRSEVDKLIKQLLECVQVCQKRFGGKTVLATEFDNCVVALCFTLEEVFLHGYRGKQQNQQSSTLKQVSDIVVNTLSLGSDNISFWPFIFGHLTKHEQERFIVLKHIWTDIGRCRAWLRSALNERSLERYFHTLLTNKDTLKTFYEDWALLRDDENNGLLPNMAAGLGSILFAVSIDKPELNSCIPHKAEAIKPKIEPIIEAPMPENKKPNIKKKKKVARQFITFDDEDAMLSSSVPSSSGSVSSETGSLQENASSKSSKASLKLINEEIKEATKLTEDKEPIKQPLTRKVSIESSGVRDKYPSEVPETLTPVTQADIGELTPVSVEINTHFEASDDTLELPSDISAVLTAVENKNQVEVDKLNEKINLLTKENNALKEQVKKYMEAIQMLRKDDEALKDLEGLEAEPDYKSEAKLFERKLVQVADMHAELMNFNVALQQSLLQKDALLERLKSELEAFRGPMPTDEVLGEPTSCVNVWIPSAFLTGTGSSSHNVYQIFLRAGTDEWNIYRRYAQFHALHTDLKKLDPVVSSFDFPPKKSIGKKDSTLVEGRRKRLQAYLRRVLNHWPELSHCTSRFLLEQHLSFFKDQKESDKNKNPFSPRRNENHYTGL